MSLELELITGTDFEILVDFQDEAGTPLNLTGCTFRAQLRRTAGCESPGALIGTEMTTANGGVVTTGQPGQIKCFLAAAALVNVVIGEAVLGILCTFADARQAELARLGVNIKQGVVS